MKGKTFWIAIVVICILALAWWFFTLQHVQAPAPDTGSVAGASQGNAFVDNSKDSAPAGPAVSAYTVKYTDQGFEPASLSVPVGTQVTFVNQSSGQMWIGSDEHPSHTSYDGTSKDEHCAPGYQGPKPFDECGTGSTFTFTFTKTGSWGYHNHRNEDDHGTIVVK